MAFLLAQDNLRLWAEQNDNRISFQSYSITMQSTRRNEVWKMRVPTSIFHMAVAMIGGDVGGLLLRGVQDAMGMR